MARENRVHMPKRFGPDSPSEVAPKQLTKQEFATRLFNLMAQKRWTQSELARRAGLVRDSVSTYVNGRSLPTPLNLQKLADALEVRPEELLPSIHEAAIQSDIPAMEMRVSTQAPTKAWLQINRLVSIHTAAKVIQLITEEDEASKRNETSERD